MLLSTHNVHFIELEIQQCLMVSMRIFMEEKVIG